MAGSMLLSTTPGSIAPQCRWRRLTMRSLTDGQFVDDPLDTFGSRAVVEVEDLQGLMRYVCRQGFEHHAAMNQSHSAAVLHEAFSNYFGWEVHWHDGSKSTLRPNNRFSGQ